MVKTDFQNDFKDLYIPDTFAAYEDDGETYEMQEVFNQLDSDMMTIWGASQFVITKNDWNYVYKIPFAGSYDYAEDENSEDYFNRFMTNYCEKAVELYALAEDANIEFLFAETDCVGKSYNDYPVYAQPKVIPYSEIPSSSRRKSSAYSLKRAEELYTTYKEKEYYHIQFEDDWIGAVIDEYGEDTFIKLINFIRENHIFDLHRGNYGYTIDNKPIIFDYSDFDF
jgi:hypothetical protein